MKRQVITKVIEVYPLGNIDICKDKNQKYQPHVGLYRKILWLTNVNMIHALGSLNSCAKNHG